MEFIFICQAAIISYSINSESINLNSKSYLNETNDKSMSQFAVKKSV
ncbi:hypothetical protein [Candidatus Cytomitobacter indipagum]|nr:hypothetical protein [Candidatus Cytomitobacter indipagum]